jgi:hypothetical protein
LVAGERSGRRAPAEEKKGLGGAHVVDAVLADVLPAALDKFVEPSADRTLGLTPNALYARNADVLVAQRGEILGAAADDAASLDAEQLDVAVDKTEVDEFSGTEAHHLAKLGRYDDPSELVDPAGGADCLLADVNSVAFPHLSTYFPNVPAALPAHGADQTVSIIGYLYHIASCLATKQPPDSVILPRIS